jgi:hypothetical protein
MEQVDARLAALELAVSELRVRADEIGALRASVAELESRLVAERTRIRTMRHTVQCPSCGGRRILHVRAINDARDSGMAPLALNTRFSAWTGVKPGEPLEAHVCRNCGLLEWHATGLDALKPDGKEIVELVSDADAPPQRAPYR